MTLNVPQGILQSLCRDGVVVVPWWMPGDELREMLAYLDECVVWPAHVAGKADQSVSKNLRAARTDGEWSAFSPRMDAVVAAPHFMEYALRCYPIAREYFGESPLLYSVNVFWTQPALSAYEETHNWHRDGDDRKQLGMFMFGTDVTEGCAHLYQRGTHRLPSGEFPVSAAPGNGSMHPHAELGGDNQSPNPADVVRVTGPAGTIFLEDPNGTHQGLRPDRPRMFAWARFGVSCPPASYEIDGLRPAPRALMGDRYPKDLELRQAIRLVVA